MSRQMAGENFRKGRVKFVKKVLKKLTAVVSSLALAAALPVSSMMVASAAVDGISLTFASDKTEVVRGDTVHLQVTVDGLAEATTTSWNALDFKVTVPEGLTLAQQSGQNYAAGAALSTAGSGASFLADVNQSGSEIIAGIIDANGQSADGVLLDLAFTVGNEVTTGSTLKLGVTMNQFAYATVQDNAMAVTDLVDSFSTEVSLTVVKTLTSIDITTEPTKKQYYVGDAALDLSGMVVTGYYNDGSNETLEGITTANASGFDTATAGDKTITITYQELTDTFQINVAELAVTNVSITAQPSKVIYKAGEELSLEGMTAQATYNSGKVETISLETGMVSGFNNQQVGEQELTLTFGGQTATFTVTVYMLGDVNMNGSVTAIDALEALMDAVDKLELTGAKLSAADVDGTVGITANDALQILQYSTKRLTQFGIETA